MDKALLLSLSTFTACWLLHVFVWRIRRPEAYPVWLPVLFLLVPLVAGAIAASAGIAIPFGADVPTVIAAFLLHAVISACYIGGYAGIIEYSPSAEILRAVQEAGPGGIEPAALNVTTLSEQALTGKRISHLITSRMAVNNDGALQLTARGQRVVALCRLYRAIFALKTEAKG
jgi:hypothetical protein